MELMELLKLRRTYRRFKQEPISDEIIDEMLTAARYASSGKFTAIKLCCCEVAGEGKKKYLNIRNGQVIFRKRKKGSRKAGGRTGLIHRNYRK